MPLRSGVLVLHLLSCLKPLICMFFVLPNKNTNLVLPVPSASYTTPTSIFFSALTNRHPTPCSSLQASCLDLFLSAGPSTACNRYPRCSESPQTSPLENDAIADRLLCGHQKLLPCLTAFVYCACEALLWSEPILTSKTSHFPRK